MDPYDVIMYPIMTEVASRILESENKLVFVVDRKATKQDIKKAIEELFKAKVTAVNTLNSVRGEKLAYITLAKETPAIDIATTLGIM